MAEARAKNKKLVYIGFGSIVVSDPDAMTKCVITAVEQSGVYAIMSKGWSDRLSTKKTDTTAAAEAVPPLPPQIYNISSTPHDWLFKQIDAACHHGGAGTTGASLRGKSPSQDISLFQSLVLMSDARVLTLSNYSWDPDYY